MNNGRWKVKIPVILTILDALVCNLPVVLLGMLLITSAGPDFLTTLCASSFIIVFVFFAIGVFVVPCEQFALIIWAIVTKKKWLLAIHIPFMVVSIIECVALVDFLHFACMQ